MDDRFLSEQQSRRNNQMEKENSENLFHTAKVQKLNVSGK
jgi:hypothetical protein